jgi:transposase InsO family protein
MGRYEVSQRRAAMAARFHRSSLRYQSQRDPLTALRQRMRELAQSRVRFGYRRLLVLLRREGWDVGKKRLYRVYTEEDRHCGASARGGMQRPSTESNDGHRQNGMTSGAWTSSPTNWPTAPLPGADRHRPLHP